MKREDWEEIEAKKEYLNGYRGAKNRERRILEQIQQLRLNTMMPSLQYSDMPHGSVSDTDLSDYEVKKEELLEELEADRLEAVRQYQKIYRSVKQMKDDNEKEALTRYYLMMEKWDDIPRTMRKSKTTFYRIYDSALRNFTIE